MAEIEERRFKCIITAAHESSSSDGLAAAINSHPQMHAVISRDNREARAELLSRTAHALILGAEPKDPDPRLLIEFVRDNPSLSHMPVFVISHPGNTRLVNACLAMGANMPIEAPPSNADPEELGPCAARILAPLRAIYHPATLLQTGGVLHHRLELMTHNVEKLRYMLLIRLLGLKAYNVYKSYDEGDLMLATLADEIGELLSQRGNHNTVLGHLASDELCLITHDRRVESLCRSLLQQSSRIFRKFYSPFELMQGHITVEDEHYSGNYYLAEVMIAGVEIPTQWNSHPVYLLDLLKELLLRVEKDDSGFKIITL